MSAFDRSAVPLNGYEIRPDGQMVHYVADLHNDDEVVVVEGPHINDLSPSSELKWLLDEDYIEASQLVEAFTRQLLLVLLGVLGDRPAIETTGHLIQVAQEFLANAHAGTI